jgi:hypothetical protein
LETKDDDDDDDEEEEDIIEVGMKMIWPETSVRINDARARERQWRRDVAAGLAGGVEAMVLRLLFENVGVVCEITLCSLFFREQKK